MLGPYKWIHRIFLNSIEECIYFLISWYYIAQVGSIADFIINNYILYLHTYILSFWILNSNCFFQGRFLYKSCNDFCFKTCWLKAYLLDEESIQQIIWKPISILSILGALLLHELQNQDPATIDVLEFSPGGADFYEHYLLPYRPVIIQGNNMCLHIWNGQGIPLIITCLFLSFSASHIHLLTQSPSPNCFHTLAKTIMANFLSPKFLFFLNHHQITSHSHHTTLSNSIRYMMKSTSNSTLKWENTLPIFLVLFLFYTSI